MRMLVFKGNLFYLLFVGLAIFGGCGDDDPTDEWIGTWTLEMWDGDDQEGRRFRAFTESLYDSFLKKGASREFVDAVIAVDETESSEEFTFDNNSRWEYKMQFKVSLTKKVKELKDSPDKDRLMEELELVNALMSSTERATGSYIVTEDGFTMTGDRRNRQFAGLMSGVWKRNGSKLTLIGDSDSRLGTIVLSK